MTKQTAACSSLLATVSVGQKATLARRGMSRSLEKKLLAIGFSNLLPLQIVQRRKGGVVVSIGNARIALNENLANQIPVVLI